MKVRRDKVERAEDLVAVPLLWESGRGGEVEAYEKWLVCYMIGSFLGVAVGSASCPVKPVCQ